MLKVKMYLVALMVLAASMFGMESANATSYIDASVAGGFTQFSADAATLAGYAWPVLLLVLGTFIGFKLTKRFANKI